MDWYSLAFAFAVGTLVGGLAVNAAYNYIVRDGKLKGCPHKPAEELDVSNIGTENSLITRCIHCGDSLAGKWEQVWTEF